MRPDQFEGLDDYRRDLTEGELVYTWSPSNPCEDISLSDNINHQDQETICNNFLPGDDRPIAQSVSFSKFYGNSVNTLDLSNSSFNIRIDNKSLIFSVKDGKVEITYDGEMTEGAAKFIEYLFQAIPWFECSIIMERDTLKSKVEELERELDKLRDNK